MSNEYVTLVSKVWNYAHVLRDEGIAYGDYLEQITYLLFLKMDDERENLLGDSSAIPEEWKWARLRDKRGDELELQLAHDRPQARFDPTIEIRGAENPRETVGHRHRKSAGFIVQ